MHCITESNMLSVKKTSPNKRYQYIPLTNKNVNIFNAYKDDRYKKKQPSHYLYTVKTGTGTCQNNQTCIYSMSPGTE